MRRLLALLQEWWYVYVCKVREIMSVGQNPSGCSSAARFSPFLHRDPGASTWCAGWGCPPIRSCVDTAQPSTRRLSLSNQQSCGYASFSLEPLYASCLWTLPLPFSSYQTTYLVIKEFFPEFLLAFDQLLELLWEAVSSCEDLLIFFVKLLVVV